MLDIGAGSGLLSMMAARAMRAETMAPHMSGGEGLLGERGLGGRGGGTFVDNETAITDSIVCCEKVVSVAEAARTIVAENGFEGTIAVVPKLSS